MTAPQVTILGLLAAVIAAMASGRVRPDLAALAALLAAVALGLVPASEAFAGFGAPAVVTVAAALVLSRGVEETGLVQALADRLLPSGAGPTRAILVLGTIGAATSAFINNVAALSLLIPAALRVCRRDAIPPGALLMPLSFATMLGGMTTLIGTPPNVIVSQGRMGALGAPFGFFDFAAAGVPVAVAGLAYLVLAGWRLAPKRQGSTEDARDIAPYVVEVAVDQGGKADGMTVAALDEALAEHDGQVLALIGAGDRTRVPHGATVLGAGDRLLLEAEAEALGPGLGALGLTLAEKAAQGAGLTVAEAVVPKDSRLVGRTAAELRLRDAWGVNLVGVSRHGATRRQSLARIRIAEGDVLLLQGREEAVAALVGSLGLLPLTPRSLPIGSDRALRAIVPFAAGIAVAVAGLAPAPVALAAAAALSVALGAVTARTAYAAIDWPVLVVLGAMLPVADAMETTGTASAVIETVFATAGTPAPPIALGVLMLVGMTLSDVMNNAATAAVMAPVAVGVAQALGAPPDPFLLAVAIGASSAFLTPIGHQNNLLVMGPGGYRFGDYWRVGLPLEAVAIAVATPVLTLMART
ncbi:SLC13 family permease [Elioraea sp. Yellowstone]|jgi:di/tricarboxylate transporter|uniref:SLC13 family permease n=1 Tax=Elioraea sp. Yellowstone TaxID=2592070 RepID=UPI00114F7F29|nr:SLC13 family permease [Elioraea sp. Yellowstone]TQF84511.1 SLC13 family permease [Elioraea sp. Yellowstone]